MAGKKRGNNEGSIYQRKDRRWVASISLEGRKRKMFYGKTRREVQERLQEALHEYKQGLLVTSPQQPLKEYLVIWLEQIHKASIRPRSYERYEQIIRLHLLPEIGSISLQNLNPPQVQQLMAKKLAEGLHPTTVINIHNLLHKALDDAVCWGLIARNVCDLVSPQERYGEKCER